MHLLLSGRYRCYRHLICPTGGCMSSLARTIVVSTFLIFCAGKRSSPKSRRPRVWALQLLVCRRSVIERWCEGMPCFGGTSCFKCFPGNDTPCCDETASNAYSFGNCVGGPNPLNFPMPRGSLRHSAVALLVPNCEGGYTVARLKNEKPK